MGGRGLALQTCWRNDCEGPISSLAPICVFLAPYAIRWAALFYHTLTPCCATSLQGTKSLRLALCTKTTKLPLWSCSGCHRDGVCLLSVTDSWQPEHSLLCRTQSGHRRHREWLTLPAVLAPRRFNTSSLTCTSPNIMIYASLKPEMCCLAECKFNQIHSKGQPSHTAADKVIIIIIKVTNPWHLKVDNYTVVFSTKPDFENTNNTQIKSFCDHSGRQVRCLK